MTRETAQKLLPIIQAYAEGKQIQVRLSNGSWRDLEYCNFDSDPSDYRIKPREPREFWLVFNDEDLTDDPSGVYTVEQTGRKGKPLPNQIRVREILDDETP